MDIELDPLAGENGGKEGHRLAKFWRDHIDRVTKDKNYVQFIKRGIKVEQRYRDERKQSDDDQRRRYSALWANVEVLRPAIYGRMPVPMVERKFGDKDPIARGAAQILERALRNEIEICGFHDGMTQAVSDYLLPGRGTLWVRYEPEIASGPAIGSEASLDEENAREKDDEQPQEQPEGFEGQPEGQPEQQNPNTEKLQNTGNQIVRESTPVDYINWRDFFIFPSKARTWPEVVGVGKRVYMTYTQMKNRFGREIAKKIPLVKEERAKDEYQSNAIDDEVKGEVFEVWDKEHREVIWVAEGYEYLLDRKDDPLNLEYFFPCPRPIIANQTNGTLIPVADYIEYQDQAAQIDDLSQRISMLTRACKVAGVYDAANRGVRRLLDESVENELIPVDNWAAFAEKGGLAGVISYLPLKEVIGVLNELITIKEKQIEEMDRLTGINDLMRGTNDARETLGGVRIKSNYTGTRLTARQNEIARFARDVVKLMADIMCQHFSPQSLVEASGAMFEEGLGVDVEGVELQLQAQQQPPAPPQNQAPGGPPPPQGAPPPPPGPPQAPPGNNVVPIRPQIGQSPVSAGPVPQTPLQAPPVAPGMPPAPPPDPLQIATQQALERIDKAIGLLRNERLRGFRVDIEVDSTIYGDAAQEKGDRNEFISAVTKYLQVAVPLSGQLPEITPLLGKLLQFGVRGFRVGRDLESTVEEFTEKATKLAMQAKENAKNQPNPEQIKANAQAMQAQATAHAAQVRAQADVEKSKGDIQTAQINAESQQQQAAAEVSRQQIENQGEQANQQMDLAMKQMELRMRQMEVHIEQIRAQAQIHAINNPPPQPVQQGSLGNKSKGI